MQIILYLNVGELPYTRAQQNAAGHLADLKKQFPGTEILVYPVNGSQPTRLEFVKLPLFFRIKRALLKRLR